MRLFILLICLLGLAAPAQAADAVSPITTRALWLCDTGSGAMVCRRIPGSRIDMSAPDAVLVLDVDIAPEAVRPDRPLMVSLTAMAASEVRWNGVLLGRNGRPGADRASEQPGRLDAVFVAPPTVVRPGRNLITARVSSHHLPIPVSAPLHYFGVSDYADPVTWGLLHYLPALVMIGVLALAGIWFGVMALLDRARRDEGLLALIAAAAVAQSLTETARVFVAYSYPWHVARLVAIAGLCSLVAVAIAAWAARRFAPRWGLWAPLATGAACALTVVFATGFDAKAVGAVEVGLLALLVCAGLGVRARAPLAWPALVVAVVGLGLAVIFGAVFLDGAYYLFLAVTLGLLLAAQAPALWRARRDGARSANALAETLEKARAADPSPVLIRDGARTHRLAAADIRFIKAADDYCEVRLVGGRTLMSSQSLTQLAAGLPEGFVRIHKSYVVNAAHVRTLAPRPGGGRSVVLADGESLPVGRTYAEATWQWLRAAGSETIAAARP